MKLVKEYIDFTRGKDPKEAMNIGLTAKRVFNSEEEMVEWILLFPQIVTEGFFKKWDRNLVHKYFSQQTQKYHYSFTDDAKYGKIEFVKWIKWNLYLTSPQGEYNPGLKESKEIADEVCKRIYETKINESQSFMRGVDPKGAMGIGLVSFESECSSIDMKKGKMDLSDPATKEFYDYLKERNIKYKFTGLAKGPGRNDLPKFRFTGTRPNIIDLLMIFFNAGRSDDLHTRKRLENLFRNYDEERDVEKLWDILT